MITRTQKPEAHQGLHIQHGDALSRHSSTGSYKVVSRSRKRETSSDSEDDRPYKRSHFKTSTLLYSQRKQWDALSDVVKLDYIFEGPLVQGQDEEEKLATNLLFRYSLIFGADAEGLTSEQLRWV